ncbi:uncharacterized protein RAG0_13007 [Rhynchosporium agropyri]|uniref:Defect at low temperature protein 1 n=1 Tax=Rhynchosporium agropyri TaxID=914238 RepID=A0A1E1LAS1_9HELO|nr:uncharacterized protein RAG0_13007 [Rhynchosporium agropyri]
MKFMPKLKRPKLSSVLYNSFYYILHAVLAALIILTPADLVVQTINNRNGPTPNKNANRVVIPGAYGVTAVIAILMLSLRITTNNNIIKAIPKTWIPVEKEDVKKKVRKMIVTSLNRSAVTAWESRPRVPEQPPIVVSRPMNPIDVVEPVGDSVERDDKKKRKFGILRKHASDSVSDDHTVTIPPPIPVWGEISHNGWSSPTSPDLPDLQYITVIRELPHLIEAKAVSIAPADTDSPSNPHLPDIRAVELLQRPAAMGLREYIGQLLSFGVIGSPATATSFLTEYEYARFSGRCLSETQFRDLMGHFAELLRSMNALSPEILTSLDIDGPESDIDDDKSSFTNSLTPRSRSLVSSGSTSSRSISGGTVRTGNARSIGTNNGTPSKRQEFGTAPVTPRSKQQTVSRSPSIDAFSQARRPHQGSSTSSSSSLRSPSQGSVIRLSDMHESGYTLTVSETR